LAEFKVFTANMPAEYGHTPNIVSAITKSGTNAFHGTVFEFLRNDAFDARNFFAVNKNVLKRNQFGGTIGGPIVRNKVFFFADIEKTTQRQGIVFNDTLPTNAMRGGNFQGMKALTDPTGGSILNNIIPTSKISPQASYFLKYMPTQSQGVFNAPQALDVYKGDVKIDAQVTNADRLSGAGHSTVAQPGPKCRALLDSNHQPKVVERSAFLVLQRLLPLWCRFARN
jgi:hypothetical protein